MGTFARGVHLRVLVSICFQVCSRGLDIKDVTHVVNLDMVPWTAEDLGAEESKKRAMGNNCKHEIHRPQICIKLLYILIYMRICMYIYIQNLKRLPFFQSIMLCAHGKKKQQHVVGMSY